MMNWFRTAVLTLLLAGFATPAFAQGGYQLPEDLESDELVEAQNSLLRAETFGWGRIGLGIGAGVVILGAALGIGRIGGQAVDAISRQPEAYNNIQTAMIIAAALIEGAAFFALILIGFILA